MGWGSKEGWPSWVNADGSSNETSLPILLSQQNLCLLDGLGQQGWGGLSNWLTAVLTQAHPAGLSKLGWLDKQLVLACMVQQVKPA